MDLLRLLIFLSSMNYLAQVDIGKTFFGSQGGAHPLQELSGVGLLVSKFLQIAFVLAGVLILFFMVFAGFQIIIGAGQNNPEAAKKGREAATAAVIGFVIIFVAYWIIRIIEAITGIPFITGQVLG